MPATSGIAWPRGIMILGFSAIDTRAVAIGAPMQAEQTAGCSAPLALQCPRSPHGRD